MQKAVLFVALIVVVHVVQQQNRAIAVQVMDTPLAISKLISLAFKAIGKVTHKIRLENTDKSSGPCLGLCGRIYT